MSIDAVVGIAKDYGEAATAISGGLGNSSAGGLLGLFGGKRIQRIDKEIAMYQALQAHQQPVSKAFEQIKQDTQKPSELSLETEVLSTESAPKNSRANWMQRIADKVKQIFSSRTAPSKNDSNVSNKAQVVPGTIADKIQKTTEEYVSYSKVSKRLKQLNDIRRIDKANQRSSYAQMMSGGSQITRAGLSLGQVGNVASVVAKAVLGFSILSSVLALGAATYGCAVAIRQLSDNRKQQQEVSKLIESNQNLPLHGDKSKQVRADEIAMLTHSLQTLQAEEALLKQQTYSQALNMVGAILSLVAIGLSIFGPQGIVYYALFIGSIALPLIALAYSHYAMNETNYVKELNQLLEDIPSLAKLPETMDDETLSLLETLIPQIVSLVVSDPAKRKELNALFTSLSVTTDKEARIKGLKKLYDYLMKLQERAIKEELHCRLKVEDIELADLETDDDLNKAVDKSRATGVYHI